MGKLLDRLSATKFSCKHAVNAVNEVTQQTPLCLVRASTAPAQHSIAQLACTIVDGAMLWQAIGPHCVQA